MSEFEARYPGKCAACDGRITPGENVRYSEDDEIMHSRCEDESAAARPVEVCGSCWLTKPCDCEGES